MNEPIKNNSSNSALAITSLIFSLLSVILGPFGFIPGIVIGHIAIRNMRRSNQLNDLGIAKAGIVIGYIFLLVLIALLGALFLVTSSETPPTSINVLF